MIRHGSLFSGIGGFDLAAQWAGWANTFQVEIDPWCQRILAKNFPHVTRHTDIHTFAPPPYQGAIDVLSGGFPCQGFSLAGKRLGTDDNRYLWPQMLEVIKRLKPTWVVGENVTGIISMEDRRDTCRDIFPVMENRTIVRYDTIDHYEALYTRQAKMLIETICKDFEKEGYQIQPLAIPAAGVGAPHKRERIWFIAHANHAKTKRFQQHSGEILPFKKTKRPYLGYKQQDAPHPHHQRLQKLQPPGLPERPGRTGGHHVDIWDDWTTEPPVCRMDDGIPHRVDRIRGLGNAIVPQVAWRIFDTINQYESR